MSRQTDKPVDGAHDGAQRWPDREVQRWWLRGALEESGLRVLNLSPLEHRPGRWMVHVLDYGITREELAGVGDLLVRTRRFFGDPPQLGLVVQVPHDMFSPEKSNGVSARGD